MQCLCTVHTDFHTAETISRALGAPDTVNAVWRGVAAGTMARNVCPHSVQTQLSKAFESFSR